MKTMSFEPYNLMWPEEFEKIKAFLWPYVKDVALDIVHVGGTAVPGLSAKPIIDIDIIINSYDDFPQIAERLGNLGYEHIGDLGIKSREVFKRLESGDFMKYHLYVCPKDSPELRRHIALRDYLRRNDSAREEYTKLKQSLAKKFRNNIDAYIEAKHEFIMNIINSLKGRKIIIVAGYSAAGKTTFASELSQKLGIPYFSKDMVKIALNRSFPVENRADSRRLSAIAFDAIAFNVERFMEVGLPLIIEANFVMKENHNGLKEGDVLLDLITRYSYQSLTYVFLGDLEVLYKRFMTRDVMPERGTANKMWGEFTFEDYKRPNIHLGEFNIGGKIVKIDATDLAAVDFNEHIKFAHTFLEG